MDATEYRKRVMNLINYAADYRAAKPGMHTESERRKAVNAAGHAMANCWDLADHHEQGDYADPIAARAWVFLAHRWEATVEAYSKGMNSNEARAALAPIKERRALQQWPSLEHMPSVEPSSCGEMDNSQSTEQHDSATRRTDASYRATDGDESS